MRGSAFVAGVLVVLLGVLLGGLVARAGEIPPGTGTQAVVPGTGTQAVVPGTGPQAVVPGTGPQAVVPGTGPQAVAPEDAEAILGQRVTGPDGKDVGRLVDLLVDANGQPRAAVIDFGGFMGVGNRQVAVLWSTLHFHPADTKRKITLDMTPDQIKAAPEFRNPNKAAAVVIPAGADPSLR